MPIDKKINLDLPVDAYDADGNPRTKEAESVSDEGSTEVSQTEEKKEEVEDKKEEEEEQRVPYSRFSKIRQEREEAIRQAEEARELLKSVLSQRREEPQESTATSSYDEEYAREIKRLYGDTPESRELIAINLKHQREIEERAERRALEAVERARNYETQAVNQNLSVIDQRIEALEDRLGRPLTEKEQDALLEIVDEYTPTGDDGKYIGEFLPFDKAWEVYELRQERQSLSSKKQRSAATAAAGARSEGDASSLNAEADKNWNPRSWKSFYDRINKL